MRCIVLLAATHAREGSARPSCLPDTYRAEAPSMTDKRIQFDFELEFTNGGGLTGIRVPARRAERRGDR